MLEISFYKCITTKHYLVINKNLNLNLIYTIFSILDILGNSIRFLILKSKIESS